MFWETLNIDYVDISYREFDQNLTLITKSIIDKEINRKIAQPRYPVLALLILKGPCTRFEVQHMSYN